MVSSCLDKGWVKGRAGKHSNSNVHAIVTWRLSLLIHLSRRRWNFKCGRWIVNLLNVYTTKCHRIPLLFHCLCITKHDGTRWVISVTCTKWRNEWNDLTSSSLSCWPSFPICLTINCIIFQAEFQRVWVFQDPPPSSFCSSFYWASCKLSPHLVVCRLHLCLAPKFCLFVEGKKPFVSHKSVDNT